MKVFISWSGDSSKAIAEALRGWLPSVLQAVKPYFSPDDITKGSRWSTEIAKELEECKIGLICLTAENLEAPWIMFETGALSKSISAARVCPLLFGVEPSDVKGPLVQFQAAPFTRDEMKKTIRMMNQEFGPAALTSDVLDSVFEMWWPKLEEKIKKVLAPVQGTAKQRARSERDILEEILARVRQRPTVVSSHMRISRGAVAELAESLMRLEREISHLAPEARGELAEIAERLRRVTEYFASRSEPDEEMAPSRASIERSLRALRREEETRLLARMVAPPAEIEETAEKP